MEHRTLNDSRCVQNSTVKTAHPCPVKVSWKVLDFNSFFVAKLATGAGTVTPQSAR
jgi:hypothetical protein